MGDPNINPLFYVDNLQQSGSDFTADLHVPENFEYTGYEVIGNSTLVPEILKIQFTVTGDKNEAPSPISKTVSVPFVLKEEENGSYFKFIITWQLNGATEGGGIGDPDDEETVGESVLQGMG